jgi:hypothetical protein
MVAKKSGMGRGFDEIIPRNAIKVSSDISEGISSEGISSEKIPSESTMYNMELLKRITLDAERNPRITIYSPFLVAMLRYLRYTMPAFSMSEEARDMLEESMELKYPDLADEIRKEMEKRA